MANIVKIFWSKVTGRVPSTLVDGQIAINQKDKKLFYPNESGVIQEFDLSIRVSTILNEIPNTATTGSTSEVVLLTSTIPANTFPASCTPNFKIKISKSGVAGIANIKLRFNIINDFATSTSLLLFSAPATTNAAVIVRNPVISSGSIRIGSTVSTQSDEATVFLAESSIAFNTAVPIYFFITSQQSTTGDTVILRSFKITN